MYENSPEYFKKFQKRFKYTICDTEPKPQDSGIENYAYGYHSSSTVTDGSPFGSSHWHIIFEDTDPEDKIVFSPYAFATIPCLVTCFKILILPTEKNFVTHGACRTLLFCCGDSRCEYADGMFMSDSRSEIYFNFCFAYLRSGRTRGSFAN